MGASAPYLNGLIAIAADSAGNIFAGTTSGIYKRSTAGVITQIVSAANVVSGYYSMAANSTLGMCWVKSYQIYCLSVVGNPYLFAGGGMGLGGTDQKFNLPGQDGMGRRRRRRHGSQLL